MWAFTDRQTRIENQVIKNYCVWDSAWIILTCESFPVSAFKLLFPFHAPSLSLFIIRNSFLLLSSAENTPINDRRPPEVFPERKKIEKKLSERDKKKLKIETAKNLRRTKNWETMLLPTTEKYGERNHFWEDVSLGD